MLRAASTGLPMFAVLSFLSTRTSHRLKPRLARGFFCVRAATGVVSVAATGSVRGRVGALDVSGDKLELRAEMAK